MFQKEGQRETCGRSSSILHVSWLVPDEIHGKKIRTTVGNFDHDNRVKTSTLLTPSYFIPQVSFSGSFDYQYNLRGGR